jgi:hypothetical protein
MFMARVYPRGERGKVRPGLLGGRCGRGVEAQRRKGEEETGALVGVAAILCKGREDGETERRGDREMHSV